VQQATAPPLNSGPVSSRLMKSRRIILAGVVALLFFCTPGRVLAAPASEAQEPWYKILAGILAIPATVIGIAVSFRLVRKTNLESRKLELEIIEKQRQLQATTGTAEFEALKELTQPFSLNQRVLLLVLRFVILELTLRLWNFLPSAAGYATSAISYSFFIFASRLASLEISPLGSAALIMVPKFIRFLFDIAYWFIVFGFGWPLLKDATGFLGISVTGLFDLPFLGRRRAASKGVRATRDKVPGDSEKKGR
jgi:hypothetical protein